MIEAPLKPVEFDLELHDAQRAVWDSDARFRVVACGRRFGKTHLGTAEIIRAAFTMPGANIGWVAPVHDQSDVAFRMFLDAIPSELVDINLTKKLVIVREPYNSRLQWKSADREKNLRADGYNFLVLDEGAFLKETTWTAALRPALADLRGRALLIGTFDGENWFYEAYLKGQDPEIPEYESWRFPTSANPYIDAAEIEEARRTLPRAEFEQEFEANPLSRVGAVFDAAHVVHAVELGREITYDPGLPTYAGIDWGFSNPTAFLQCQQTPDDYVRWYDETLWYSVELNERCQAIAQVCSQREIRAIYADAAGKDENVTLAKHLKGTKTQVVPVPFNKFKDAGIIARRWFLENGRELLGPRMKQTVADTKAYHYAETASGVRKDEVEKIDDHTVDAATAFYATRFPAASGRTNK